jgi:ABC-2 type transport system permease protein
MSDDAQVHWRSASRGAVSPTRALRTLFLTLFLRGRSARGIQAKKTPKSVGQKLALVLLLYLLFGFIAIGFRGQPVFLLSAYLHAMTFVFLGMFVASSAGEILFNREEADILMHRPIEPRALLWAKVRVLTEVSVWLAAAINLVGLFVGMTTSDGNWLFPVVHLLSLVMEALFCTASVVMVYQLCLRWFGRERLEGMMTTAQVLISLMAVLGGQIVPQLLMRVDKVGFTPSDSWWPILIPPAWFAGLVDALAGSGSARSWLYAVLAISGTVMVLWLAFGKLAGDYEAGLQTLNETVSSRKKTTTTRRLLHKLVDAPPLRWWLRDPVVRASFLLSAAYLVRDRDVKLRMYPAIAPLLVFPVIMLFQGFRGDGREVGGFSFSFACGYLGLVPLMALNMLQFSQDWQAADVFRAAPLAGPAPVCHGARWAVLCFTTFPLLLALGVVMGFASGGTSQWLLLIPPLIALPIFALVPHLNGRAVPLSQAVEESQSASRGLSMMGTIFFAMLLAGGASWAWSAGYLWHFVAAEASVVLIAYFVMMSSINNSRWSSLE